MTQPSLLLPFKISSSVAEEHEYTAHEMWVMAEISGRSHSSYLLVIQSVTIISKKEVVTADSKGYFVGPKLCKLP